MKKVLFTLLILMSTISHSQNFEGILTYELDIEVSEKMKEMGMSKEVLIEKMKESNTFFKFINYTYKNDNYLIEPKKSGTKSIYRGDVNKIYTIQENEDIIVGTDASIDLQEKMTGKLPKIQNSEENVVINDKPCKKVSVIWDMGTYEYFYNSGYLKANPNLYKNHIYDGWYEFLKISKSLPFKIVKRQMGMTMTLKLINISETPIEDNIFKLPKMKIDKKMNEFSQKNQTIFVKK
jgi:hypothetical protein